MRGKYPLLLLMMILGFAVPALAETYKWTDDRGTVNFSDDLAKVPKRYLNRVKVVGGEPTEPVVTEVTEEGKGGNEKGKEKEKQGKAADAADKSPEKKQPVYGGKNADAWREEFATLKAEIKQTQDSLSDRQAQMSDTSKMTRGQYLGIQHEIKRLETKLTTLQGKLEALSEAARKAGVPADVR